MKAVKRIAIWTAVLLLVLAGAAWAGVVLIEPYYFLVPGIALTILIAYVTVVAGPQKKPAAGSHANARD
jgi:hypothetical protein